MGVVISFFSHKFNHYSFVCILVLVLSMVASQCYANTFRIVATPQSLFRIQTDNGLTGIDVDVIALVMAELKVPYEIELVYSAKRIIHEAKEGEADMILSFSNNTQRQTYLDYPEVSYKEVSWHFFTLAENQQKYRFERFSDLQGISIAAVKEFSYSKAFWQADLNLTLVSNAQLLLPMLLKKRVDLIPMNKMNLLHQAKKLGRLNDISMLQKPIKIQAYFNPFSKQSRYPNREALIKQYDAVVRQLINNGKIAQVYDKYLN